MLASSAPVDHAFSLIEGLSTSESVFGGAVTKVGPAAVEFLLYGDPVRIRHLPGSDLPFRFDRQAACGSWIQFVGFRELSDFEMFCHGLGR